MAIGRVPGSALLPNLDRQGIDLAFTTNNSDLVKFDFANFRVGINNSNPEQSLDVVGNVQIDSGDLLTTGNLEYSIGRQNHWFKQGFIGNIIAQQVQGTILTADQPNITNIGTLGNLSIAGTITASTISADTISATTAELAALNVDTLVVDQSATIDGNLTVNLNISADHLSSETISGTILSNAQPNITTIGTLTTLAVAGNAVFANVAANVITTQEIYQNGYPVLSSVSQISVVGDVNGAGTADEISVELSNTGVTPGTYGSADDVIADRVPKITVDSKGRITSIAEIPLTQLGNLSFVDTTISSQDTLILRSTAGNIVLDAELPGRVEILGTGAVVIPTGNTLQRPTSESVGQIRFNTDEQTLEYYTGDEWATSRQVLYAETLYPDGVSNTYVMSLETTTSSLFVSINGTLQQPNIAYTVTGNTIVFSETPLSSDIIDLRELGSSVSEISVSSVRQLAAGPGTTITAENTAITIATNSTEQYKITETGALVISGNTISINSGGVMTSGIVDEYDKSLYRTAKYLVQVTALDGTETYEALVTHNGSLSNLSTSNYVQLGNISGTLSSQVSANSIQLVYTTTSDVEIVISKNYLKI